VKQQMKRMRALLLVFGAVLLGGVSWAHVTFRPNQAFPAGGSADITMMVPTERAVGTVSVSIEVPDAFLKAGGRLSRLDFPAGWQVKIDREDKPGDVYASEMDQRAKRNADPGHVAPPPKTPAEKKEQDLEDQMRRKWIKKVTFAGGMIPPDGFKAFSLELQLPTQPGVFRFPAIQTYADGVQVSWTDLVEGAPHPAPTLVVGPKANK
jgi:hypothetical protein